ncbi:MAG: SAM-dependent methyltransferase, partial [Firmicutes bacterium]|nr:SAM-dependent methyltransferase [Bacillota bacterium]
ALTALALEENPEQDFLGTIYFELSLLNKHLGQVFTPYHIAKLMAEISFENIAAHIDEKGFASVYDPTCGSGVMLIAAANVAREKGINYQRSMVFVGQDIDFTVAMMAYIQLTLLGCAGYVGVGNTLTEPLPSRENIWYMPMNRIHRKLWEGFCHSK